jgi:hypothetical protein
MKSDDTTNSGYDWYKRSKNVERGTPEFYALWFKTFGHHHYADPQHPYFHDAISAPPTIVVEAARPSKATWYTSLEDFLSHPLALHPNAMYIPVITH